MQSSITRVLPRVAAIPRVAAAVPARSASSMGSNFYRYVARSNVTYVSYIIGGAILLEAIYGKTLDGLWNGLNSGVRICRPRRPRMEARSKEKCRSRAGH